MEEIQNYLETNAQDVEGIQMVPLSMALEAIQTAGNINMIESLDKAIADLHKSLEGTIPLDDID
jgi:hypothetical protein